jgi:hypothetical protein
METAKFILTRLTATFLVVLVVVKVANPDKDLDVLKAAAYWYGMWAWVLLIGFSPGHLPAEEGLGRSFREKNLRFPGGNVEDRGTMKNSTKVVIGTALIVGATVIVKVAEAFQAAVSVAG